MESDEYGKMKMAQTGHHKFIPLIAAALLVALAGCASEQAQWTGAATMKRNSVELVRLMRDVAVSDDESPISAAAGNTLRDFFRQSAFGYGDQVSVDGGDGPGAALRARKLAAYLAAMGIRATVSPIIYGASPKAGQARVIIGRYVVHPPKCPDWTKAPTRDFENTESSNFGCATVTNLGLMAANPRDLIVGNGGGRADSEVLAKAVEQYRLGKAKALNKTSTGNEEDKK